MNLNRSKAMKLTPVFIKGLFIFLFLTTNTPAMMEGEAEEAPPPPTYHEVFAAASIVTIPDKNGVSEYLGLPINIAAYTPREAPYAPMHFICVDHHIYRIDEVCYRSEEVLPLQEYIQARIDFEATRGTVDGKTGRIIYEGLYDGGTWLIKLSTIQNMLDELNARG